MRAEATSNHGGAVVHVVDDDPAARDGLANLLRSAGFAVQSFSSPKEFADHWRPTDRGCLILDIHFPEHSGLDFQLQLKNSGIAMPVILMTGHADVSMSIRGMKGGAVDFLIKPFEEQPVLNAIAEAFERDALRIRRETQLSNVAQLFGALTSREKQVFALVTKGLMNKQIAGELNLSEITVKVHRGTLMRKMKVRTLADLVKASEILRVEGVREFYLN